MNIIKEMLNKKDRARFFEDMLRRMYYDTHRKYMDIDLTPEIAEIFYKEFKDNVRTLRAFNYSIHTVKMYSNQLGTIITVHFKDEKLSKLYAISFDLRWW